MTDYTGKWGIYTFRAKENAHPEDQDKFTFSASKGMFQCIGYTEDDYIILRNANDTFRVDPQYFIPKRSPAFKFGDRVRWKENPQKTGIVRYMMWHWKQDQEFYYLRYPDRDSTRRYFSDELELIKTD